MFPRHPSSFKAFLATSVGYVMRLTGKAGRVLLPIAIALSFYGCQFVDRDVRSQPAVQTSVVLITNGDLWAGSAVVVGKSASRANACKVSVLSAAHVVTHADNLTIDGVKAFSVVVHPNQDIALVVFMFDRPCALVEYGVAELSLTDPQPLDEVIHVGFPGKQYMIGYATFIGRVTLMDSFNVAAITAVAGHGSSGGGVFYNGRLVGILVFGENQPPFRNYYTPVSYALELMPEING